ncbi:MAG TPA: YbaB/EbfC family nucleoid-associated protein [Actinophytocola sp.]|nr:YbaB/EbfC family nucleoid-associated protein [Actinophytocola sp.]
MSDEQASAAETRSRPPHGTALAAMLTAMDISPIVALSVLTPSPGPGGEHRPQSSGQRDLDVAISLGIGVLAVEPSPGEPGPGHDTDPHSPSRPHARLADILGRFRMPRDGSRGTTGRTELPMSEDRTGEAIQGAGSCLPTSGELMAGLDRLREVLTQVQRDIENVIVHGTSRDNEVTATMQGSGELVDIAIDPDQARQRTADDLSGSVTEAVNDALRKLGNTTKARIASLLAAPDSP